MSSSLKTPFNSAGKGVVKGRTVGFREQRACTEDSVVSFFALQGACVVLLSLVLLIAIFHSKRAAKTIASAHVATVNNFQKRILFVALSSFLSCSSPFLFLSIFSSSEKTGQRLMLELAFMAVCDTVDQRDHKDMYSITGFSPRDASTMTDMFLRDDVSLSVSLSLVNVLFQQ